MAVDRIEIISSTDEEEGFQRGPEVLQIQNDNNPEDINAAVEENEEVPEDLEENDENEKPQNGAVEDDSDSGCCPICLEPWTSAGRHRLCSLRCGHLFGRVCIDRWLAGGKIKCPQCNAPAKRADIRVLYCKKLVALDTAEQERLEASVQAERLEKRRLEEALAQANLNSQLLRAELESLKSEFGRFKRRKIGSFGGGGDSSVQKPFTFLRRVVVGHGTEFQCRSVVFDSHYGIFLVSRSDGSSHGVVKVSLLDPTGAEFVSLHSSPLRAICSSPHGDGLYLTAASDNLLRLCTMSSNSVLQTWTLPENNSPWSCCFHPKNINQIFVGLSGCLVAVYDLRKAAASAPIFIKILGLKRSNIPIHSLHILELEKDDFYLIGGTMDGPFAQQLKLTDSNQQDIEDIEEEERLSSPSWTRSQIPLSWSSDFGYSGFTCNSVSIDPKTCSIFASFRSLPPAQLQPSRHVIFNFTKTTATTTTTSDGDLQLELQIISPFFEFKSLGSHRMPFKSSFCSTENQKFSCFITDEPSFSGHCYHFSTSNPTHQPSQPSEILSTNAGIPILETCFGKIKKSSKSNFLESAELDNENYLESENNNENNETFVVGMLTSKNLYIYTSE